MLKFLFLLAAGCILLFLYHKFLVYFVFFRFKKKITANPLIGIKQIDKKCYSYKEDGYTLGYRIIESFSGEKKVEWLFLKRKLTFFEERLRDVKKGLNKLFSGKKWLIFFHPAVLITVIMSLCIFYFGIREHSLKRIERFKWLISKISGIAQGEIKYTGRGEFTVSGQKVVQGRALDPVTINFNPFSWLFFSGAATVTRWNEGLKKYVNYSVSIADTGDVWIKKKSGKFHGKIQNNKLTWDKPPGDTYKSPAHYGIIKDGKLNIYDE